MVGRIATYKVILPVNVNLYKNLINTTNNR